jgi:hypothetical protein
MTFTSQPPYGAGSAEPVDIRAATWSPAVDWAIVAASSFAGLVLGSLLAVQVLPVAGALLAFTTAMAGLYGWSAYRALRLRPGLEPLAQQAARGEIAIRVIDRGRAGIAPLWALRPAVLRVGQGMVQLGDEWWPASAVVVAKRPNLLFSRGIGLSGPAGPRFVSVLPGLDPAIWWAALVDQDAVGPLEAALVANARIGAGWPRLPDLADGTPVRSAAGLAVAGWYADPWRPGGWRWWDGTRWSEHQR